MLEPTPYADLNGVLVELTAGVRQILAANFVGAYLVGSFAVGDADMHSDVDFVVVIETQLTKDQQSALQALHERLFALDVPWAQHLEGSYIPRDVLRSVEHERTQLFYFDNGSTKPAWDDHCNTAVVRWSLREHGIVLAGPDPIALVEPVAPEALRGEALLAAPEYASWSREPGMSRWKQPYLVLSLCRVLRTIDSGRVVSKREAGEWAIGALDPAWADLIQAALDDRPDPWQRVHQAADVERAERTRAFVDYAVAEAQNAAV